MQRVRPAQREHHSLSETFNHCDISIVEGARLGGEDFQQTHDVTFVKHRGGQYWPNLKLATSSGVDARIELWVVAAHGFSEPDAFATETSADINQRPNRENCSSRDCAADHARFIAQRHRSTGAASDRTCPAHDQRQRSIQIATEGFEFVLHTCGGSAISIAAMLRLRFQT
jgi:hypothetical protein